MIRRDSNQEPLTNTVLAFCHRASRSTREYKYTAKMLTYGVVSTETKLVNPVSKETFPIVVSGMENPVLFSPFLPGSASLAREPEAVGIVTKRPETEIVRSYSPSAKPNCSVSSVPSRRTRSLSGKKKQEQIF